MAYEIYVNDRQLSRRPVITLSKEGRLIFNLAATRIIRASHVNNVFLLWDKKDKRIAIRACTSNTDRRAFQVRYRNRGKWAVISAKGFLEHIGHDLSKTQALPATWKAAQRMMEADVGNTFGKLNNYFGTHSRRARSKSQLRATHLRPNETPQTRTVHGFPIRNRRQPGKKNGKASSTNPEDKPSVDN